MVIDSVCVCVGVDTGEMFCGDVAGFIPPAMAACLVSQ